MSITSLTDEAARHLEIVRTQLRRAERANSPEQERAFVHDMAEHLVGAAEGLLEAARALRERMDALE
jgi:hypothetical protein